MKVVVAEANGLKTKLVRNTFNWEALKKVIVELDCLESWQLEELCRHFGQLVITQVNDSRS